MPPPNLTEPHFGHVELAAAAGQGVGSESTFTQREAQNQIGRSAVNKGSGGVFRVNVGANAEVAGDEVIKPQSGAQPGIAPDSLARPMIEGVFPDRSSPEHVQGQFAGPSLWGKTLPGIKKPIFCRRRRGLLQNGSK